MSIFKDVFTSLVDAFDGIPLSSGKFLASTTKENNSLPRLQWEMSGWNSTDWQPFVYKVDWKISAVLHVQGPSGELDPIQETIADIYEWADQVKGLPHLDDLKVVPFSQRQLDLAFNDKLLYFGDQFVGPIVESAKVRHGAGDNTFSLADLVFSVSFLVDYGPSVSQRVHVVTVGGVIGNVQGTANPYNRDEPFSPVVPALGDTATWTAFTVPGPALYAGTTPIDPSPYPLQLDIPGVVSDPATLGSMTVAPAMITAAPGTTAQLQAIGVNLDGSTLNLTSGVQWLSTDTTIATVAGGLVTPLKSGTVYIIATLGVLSGACVVTVSNIAVDLTASTLPAGVSASARTGGDLLVAQSASVYARQVAGSQGVYEDRGNNKKGWWAFAAYTNDLNVPENLLDAAWSNLNSAAVTSGLTAPDGTATAFRIVDNSAGAYVAVYQLPADVTGDVVHSLWVKDGPTPPTLVGGIWADAGAQFGSSFGTGSAWRRIGAYASSGLRAHALTPAGYVPGVGQSNPAPVFTTSATGGVEVAGNCRINTGVDLPGVMSSTGAQDLVIGSQLIGGILTYPGDLNLKGRIITEILGNGFGNQPDGYVFHGLTSGGVMSLRYQQSIGTWTLTVRGVDVLTMQHFGMRDGSILDWRVRYRPSDGVAKLSIKINGCFKTEATATATGSALSQPTAFRLGSNGSGSAFAGMYQSLDASDHDVALLPAEFLMLGDSIMADGAQLVNVSAVGSFIYTDAEVDSRPGVVSLAVGGDTAEGQQAKFLASAYAGNAAIKGVAIQVGINNIFLSGDSSATLITKLQALVNAVRASIPTTKIVLMQMIPAKAILSGAQYTTWLAVNAAITNGTITGIDRSDSTAQVALNDGAGNLRVEYNIDGVHPKNPGRNIIAQAIRADFVALGLL
jgi:lysophospholipase L1-like esterase